MTKSDLDPAAYQIVIFDKENSHKDVLKWCAEMVCCSGVSKAAKRMATLTGLTVLGQ